jgi:NADPH:quinone reductase-like Zn-dependent oxidoreductase
MLALIASPGSEANVELREVPPPAPRPNETLVDVRAISLNRGEVHRIGTAPDGTRFGWDFAGVVARPSDDGSGLAEGTRVVGWRLGSAWAQQVAAGDTWLAPIPDTLSFEDASTLPVAGLTALRLLRAAGLLLGKRVLITGAAGGVGRFAVQLAHRAGAHVTGVMGSLERGKGLRELGADELVIDLAAVQDQFDVILESAGGPSLAEAFRLIAPQGLIATFGNSSRQPTTFSIQDFYSKDGASLQAFLLLSPYQPRDFTAELAYLAGLVAEGALKVDIGFRGSWRQAPEALRALRERRVQGKAVLTVD